jgi:hypothetical protein
MSEKTSVADPRAVTRDIFSATLGSIACCYTGQVRLVGGNPGVGLEVHGCLNSI